jgi:hypothetical protein
MSFDEAAFQRKVTEHAARARADAGPPKAGDDRPVRWREFLEQSLFVRNVIREYIDRQLAERDQKIEALEKEIDDLRKYNADAMKYCGTFNRSQVYERGHVCTHSGVLWFAIKDTVGQQPGNSENWQLMTKHNTVKAIEGNTRSANHLTGKL